MIFFTPLLFIPISVNLFHPCLRALGEVVMQMQLVSNPTVVYQSNTTNPLFEACLHGQEGEVQILLDDPETNVNQGCRKYGRTPLWIACQYGQEGVVRIMLNHARTNVNRGCLNYARTPLWIACQYGQEGVVRLMLNHTETDVNNGADDRSTPLFMACMNNHKGIVRLLLTNPDTDVNQGTGTGRTPLYISCLNQNTQIVKLLLSDSRTDRIRPNNEEHAKVYDLTLRYVKNERKTQFRGLVRLVILLKRMRTRAAEKVYAPGGSGFLAAENRFKRARTSTN